MNSRPTVGFRVGPEESPLDRQVILNNIAYMGNQIALREAVKPMLPGEKRAVSYVEMLIMKGVPDDVIADAVIGRFLRDIEADAEFHVHEYDPIKELTLNLTLPPVEQADE